MHKKISATLFCAFRAVLVFAFEPLFDAKINNWAGDGLQFVLCVDLDGDLDLTVANYRSDNISILLNQTICSNNDVIISYLEVNQVLPGSTSEIIPGRKTEVRAYVTSKCNRVARSKGLSLCFLKMGRRIVTFCA